MDKILKIVNINSVATLLGAIVQSNAIQLQQHSHCPSAHLYHLTCTVSDFLAQGGVKISFIEVQYQCLGVTTTAEYVDWQWLQTRRISPPQVQRTSSRHAGPLLYICGLVRFLLALVTNTTWLGKHCGLAHNNYIAYETSAPLCAQSH